MFDKKDKPEIKQTIKVYGQNEKVVAKATPKCKFHKTHDRHCVDCN